MVKVMSRKQRKERQFGPAAEAVVERIEPPKPKRYVPPKCSMCTALRPESHSGEADVTRTTHDGGYTIRYCKCRYCGNTFKSLQKTELNELE